MLPFYKKVAYGMGRFGSSFFLTLTSLTSFWIYGTVFELNWLLNGVAIAVSYIVIGLTQWLVGYYSDQTETRWGRRKPFVAIGAPALTLTGFLLFVPNWFINVADPSLELIVFGYYLFFVCTFRFFYGFLLTPFQSWMPEITEEDERPLVSSMQNTANWVANGLGVVLGFVTPLLFAPAPAPPGLSSMGFMLILMVAVITVLFYLPSIAVVREKPGLIPTRRSLSEETRTVLQNNVYVRWFIIVGFLSFSLTAITTQIVGYAQSVLMLTTWDTLLPPAIGLLISVITFLYIWTRILGKTGKGRLLMYALIILAFLLALTPVLGILAGAVSNVVVALFYFIPLAACMAVYYLMSYIVPADIAHVDQLKTGMGRAGIYEGFKSVPLNVFQAAAVTLLGFFMEYSVITTGVELMGYLWWGPVFAPFLLVAAWILRSTNIDPDFEALKQEAQPSQTPVQ
ncbi:MAG: MFS transporter [Candidatus Thorarchaeota archaeon]